MLLGWFLRQRLADKIAVVLFAAAMTPIIWTALASFMFILLMGPWARQHFPFGDPATYWQWWAFFLDDAQPLRVHRWLAVSGIAAVAPFVAFIVRQVMDYVGGSKGGISVYGRTGWANQKQMKARGISTSKRPF
jgi:hypothetical protein